MIVCDVAAPYLVDICKLAAYQQIAVPAGLHAIGSPGLFFPVLEPKPFAEAQSKNCPCQCRQAVAFRTLPVNPCLGVFP